MSCSAVYRLMAMTLLAAICVIPSSCAPSDTREPPAATEAQAQPEEIPPAETAARAEDAVLTVTLGDEKTLEQWLSEGGGKIVLVDFWATWCGPCVEKMPHVVELQKAHRDAGLVLITVSMDEPDDESKVRALLEKVGATGRHLITRYGAGTAFAEAFNIPGDVPFYRLYDRTGKLRYQFSANPSNELGTLSPDELDQRVDELLAETRP